MKRLALVALAATTFACGSSNKAEPPSGSCQAAVVKSERLTLAATQTPTAGFALPAGTQPVGLVLDRDGSSLWLLGQGPSDVLHVSPDGTAMRYDLPVSALGLQGSQAADGTVWVPEQYRDAVMALAPDGTARECHLPRGKSEPVATSVGQDGSVWVSEGRGGAIARLSNGRWAEFPIGVPGVLGSEVVAARDGGAWFAVEGGKFIGHVTVTGEVNRTPIGSTSGMALGILEAPDGAIWVADFGGDRVVRVGPDGTPAPFNTRPGGKPQSFAVAPDGGIWFTESGANRLARVRGYELDDSYMTGAWPDHLVITATGEAWFTEYYQDALGAMRLAA